MREDHKSYPRDWTINGRVKVAITMDGSFVNPKIKNSKNNKKFIFF